MQRAPEELAEPVAEGISRPVTFVGDRGGDRASDSPCSDAAAAAGSSGPRAHGRTKSSTAVCWMSSSSDSEEVDPRRHNAAMQDGEYDVTETGLHAIASCIALLVAAPNAEKGRWLGELVRSVAATATRHVAAVVRLVCCKLCYEARLDEALLLLSSSEMLLRAMQR